MVIKTSATHKILDILTCVRKGIRNSLMATCTSYSALHIWHELYTVFVYLALHEMFARRARSIYTCSETKQATNMISVTLLALCTSHKYLCVLAAGAIEFQRPRFQRWDLHISSDVAHGSILSIDSIAAHQQPQYAKSPVQATCHVPGLSTFFCLKYRHGFLKNHPSDCERTSYHPKRPFPPPIFPF